MVGLDRELRLCGVGVNGNHRSLSFVKVWELAALVEQLDASALVVGLVPPGPSRVPSSYAVESFVELCARARRARVTLLDCVVVRGHRWWSLRELSAENRST